MLNQRGKMSKSEICNALQMSGAIRDTPGLGCIISLAEIDGLICGTIDERKKPVYTLLETHVPESQVLSRTEALGTLARRYFRSHSPATLLAFSWWSGLSITEAREAIGWIKEEPA